MRFTSACFFVGKTHTWAGKLRLPRFQGEDDEEPDRLV